MNRIKLLAASALYLVACQPALAQDQDTGIDEADAESTPGAEIIVTAQRRAQSLQDVPLTVTAFGTEALERQQIRNSSDLQLTLPNVTFTKTAFTSASFTIRGIGDLCVGQSCDAATAIHVNGSPLFGTRLFETEFFDLERIEVLRGPQGTLFGRNATGGVVNIVTARPDTGGFAANFDGEYGNFESVRLRGMVNVPLTDTLAVRVAGMYLNRDGYTRNLFDNSLIDGRDMFALRGSVRWEPTSDTSIDLMAYWFREDDDRLRIQKQLCQRDPTGVLGCLPGRLAFEAPNANASFTGTLTSREFLRWRGGTGIGPGLSLLALTSLYGPDSATGARVPDDVRTVDVDFQPTYFADEKQFQGRLDHDFGAAQLQLTGLYSESSVDSRQDQTLLVTNRAIWQPGIDNLANYAAVNPTALGATINGLLAATRSAIIPGGARGQLCTSIADPLGVGAFAGRSTCADTPVNFDRSVGFNRAWSAEAILTAQPAEGLNLILGGIYADNRLSENSYYVSNFGTDYVAGVLGVLNTLSQRQAGNAAYPAVFLATPFFRSNTDEYRLKSYGIFGEAAWELTGDVTLTAGLRYNNDRKSLRARSTLASFPAPVGTTSAFDSPFAGNFDADQATPGNQPWQDRAVGFDALTGRAVIDWQVTPDSMIYASYSRGYKSGGINPPVQPGFDVPENFSPEYVNAFEIGTKNLFANGVLQLNASAFYYQYKGLQLSRLVARTAINDNVDADIYGFEAEAVVRPARGWRFDLNFSALKTKVTQDLLMTNPRDPSGGRADAVIIKDITNASNCAVVPTVAGNAAGTNTLVATVNQGIGAGVGAPGLLRAPTAFPTGSGINGATGAFSICSALANAIANPSAALRTSFATPTGPLPFTLEPSGVPVNIRGNQLPQAPDFKVSAGAQHTADLGAGMSLVLRGDIAFTGESYGSIFNGNVNRVEAFAIINAQVQLNGRDDRWFARAFVQNLTDNDAITGLALTDASTGLGTGVFALEPRRYGVAFGTRF